MAKPASPALVALLRDSSSFIMADLYEFELATGDVLRYSGAATALEYAGFDFLLGPKFDRGGTRVQIGTQVDELDLWVYAGPDDKIGGLTWQEASHKGLFDSATLKVQRVFMPSYGDMSAGAIAMFFGDVSTITIHRSAVNFKVRALIERLNIQMPRRLWQSACTHIFGGKMCLFDRTTMRALATALDGSTSQGEIVSTLAPSPSNLYDQGTLISSSGQNNLHQRTVTAIIGGSIFFKPVFLFPVEVGDTFSLLPGCDRSLATCRDTFSNDEHFGGFPWIPSPETAI